MQRQKIGHGTGMEPASFFVKANKQGECMEMVPLTAIDKADTGWVTVASALVLLMTLPGIALFYAGLVRRKNVVNTMVAVFAVACGDPDLVRPGLLARVHRRVCLAWQSGARLVCLCTLMAGAA
jgi:hypothetical protein